MTTRLLRQSNRSALILTVPGQVKTLPPMPTVTRYVLLELAKLFLFALTAMTLMMLLVGIVAEATRQGLGPAQVIRLIPFLLPEALRFTVPGTILFAVCSLYGRMAGSNEIVAIKSLGISPMRIITPVLVLVFLLSLATVWLNDLAVSWGRSGVRRVVIEAVEEIAYGMLRTHRAYSTNHFSINVKRVDGRKLVRPTLTFQSSGNSPAITLTAEDAELVSDREANELVFICNDSTVYVDGKVTVFYPGEMRRAIPLEKASGSADNSLSASNTPLHSIDSRVIETMADLERFEQQRAAKAAFQLLTGDMVGLTSREWETDWAIRSELDQIVGRLHTEPHRRWANGFSCLCFVMLGIPMAIQRRNADFLSTFFLCFLPILILYYPLLAVGVDQAKRGTLPPYSVWMGNILLIMVGAWLLRRVVRY